MTAKIPVEKTLPGVGLQRVNAYDPETGAYSHQVVHHGTEAQARAKAEIGFVHHTSPRWHELRAIILGAED